MLGDRAYMRGSSFGSQRSATVTLVIINVVVFVLQNVFQFWHTPTSSLLFGSRHAETSALLQYGLLPLSQSGLAHGYVWQLVTYQFLHGGMLHLLVNMLLVYFFGRALEDAL